MATDGATLEGAERERYVHAMFDRIAGRYDRLNRIISLGADRRWRRTALHMGRVGPGCDAIDLGTGTGDLYLMLVEAVGEGRVTGVDLSDGMLAIAREKASALYPERDHQLHQGSAEATGLPASSADVVTMGWVLRNVGDREATYREVLRLLRPGGRFVCVDMSRSGFPPVRWGQALYLAVVMRGAVKVFGGDAEAYGYLGKSTARFPLKPELADEMRSAGFVGVSYRSLMMGSIAIHVGEKPGVGTGEDR